MSNNSINRKEHWNYIFKVFPIIDLPFNALAIYLSDNWIVTLVLAVLFPIIASTIIFFTARKNLQPGPYILSVNGILFLFYVYYSGANSPTWLSMINITVGVSFMFNNPKIGQLIMVIYSILIGLLFYLIGASAIYSITISLTLLSFVVLFSRAHSYMNLQQQRLSAKSKELELKQKDITDSINYAKRIQYAVLPHEETIYRSIPLSFIFYKPKDIVSGDFFWFHEINRDEYILVCADCTGHGVPGAFMTVIGSSLLNQTVIDNKIVKPSEILLELDKQINFTLKQQKETGINVQDGMDLTLIKVNKLKKEILLTSAKRTAIFIRNKEIKELKGSKFSLGGMRTGDKHFEELVLNYQEDDILYMFTDGYADQFGGEKGKKFSTKRLKELLLNVHKLPISEQKEVISNTISHWMNTQEQVDDILITGIKF